MNFSNYRKFSKLLSLILIITLLCTLFAGCKKEEDPSDSTPNTVPGLNLLPETDPTTVPTSASVATTPTESNENMGTVTQQMNIRSTPSMQAVVMGTLYAGDRVEVLRQDTVVGHVWGYIKEPEEGWIVMDYVEMDVPSNNVDSNETPASSNGDNNSSSSGNEISASGTKGVITGNGINIRSEASTNGTIQGSYNKGDVVTILETKDGWGRTDKGWVKLDYVSLNDSTSGTTNNNTSNTNNNTNNSTANTSSGITGNGSTTVVAKGIVKVNELNLRSTSSTNGERLGSLKYGDRVEILQTDGSWGRTSKGWISLSYVDLDNGDGSTGGNTTSTTSRRGTVISGLYVRSGAGTNYEVVSSYEEGDVVTILETKDGWGRTSEGWVSLKYIDFDDSDSSSSSTSVGTGTIIADGGLRVRAGAGSNYAVVSGLEYGDRVTILETKNGWGRIAAGWISMDYVDMD